MEERLTVAEDVAEGNTSISVKGIPERQMKVKMCGCM